MSIIESKKQNSLARLEALRGRLETINELNALPHLTIFVAGSYARNEASIHSDIDLFFIYAGKLRSSVHNPNIKSMRAFSRIIEEADKLEFPAFSNDGEFLRILESPEMKRELGGRNDDYLNYFTARMLMLLESTSVYKEDIYIDVMNDIVESYFRDYTHHPADFRPVFLINDIIRFWKTLCLNYENKRNQPAEDEEKKIKQKIKNFKLKFSRMLTCYGTIAAIAHLEGRGGPAEIIGLVRRSPYERLIEATYLRNEVRTDLNVLTNEYTWFLETTDVSEGELIDRFRGKTFREEAFQRAEKFGDSMFRIVSAVASDTSYLRYLVI